MCAKLIPLIYKKGLLPKWLCQVGSDILVLLAQILPHPKLRIAVWKLRGANLHGVKYIGMNCLIGNYPWLLTIKRNAVVSSGTRILTEDYSYQNVGGEKLLAPVVIEENVHIGMDCIILPGVRIGKNSIIGAGSVVMHSIPANSVAIGNPAKVIMSVKVGKLMLKKRLGKK
ncbi:hypothetical protein DRJ48_03950 [Candidatus Woesearchaeota archaeon]|nr:acyltransferase [Candidatus Woesearchaeota archaeon]RLE42236.1 MAG: hypothetical protein DRJ48_03950 [Candidatus Woesearchaeota archaeon]